MPDQQLVVDDGRLVALRTCPQRHPLAVGNHLALAVGAPAPVVERAGDLVALDRPLRQVAAHVPAVPVEDAKVALGILEDDELAAEAVNGVRLAVPERVGETKAVPAPSKS